MFKNVPFNNIKCEKATDRDKASSLLQVSDLGTSDSAPCCPHVCYITLLNRRKYVASLCILLEWSSGVESIIFIRCSGEKVVCTVLICADEDLRASVHEK